ncbi:MAG: ornithine cyclodeaminase family protein [Rhodospirillales bacterium]
MSAREPIWLTEAEVVSLMTLGDAIDALERTLPLESQGAAVNLTKTQVGFNAHDSLHALGAAVPGAGLVGTKTWAHTEGGAAPTLILWDSKTGALRAVVEAFALGQMRTGGISGLATRWLARPDADEMAVIGTGPQAVTQVAAVHAVRPLKRLRVFSPTAANRRSFAERMAAQFGFEAVVAETAEAAAKDAPIVTVVTRATAPILSARMLAAGTHVNAVGAIVPARIELARDVFPRCTVVAVDEPATVRNLSQEFRDYYDGGGGDWADVRPISAIVAAGAGRPAGADLTLFKAMGMGLSDLAMGIELLARAERAGAGRPLPTRERAAPRLQAAE